MILIIDNYDSFVYTLAGYVEKCGAPYEVHRNDKITIDEIWQMRPAGIILSPGPCTPNEAGICIDVIRECGTKIPILGVCLGHQAIADAYGGKTVRAGKPVHGKNDKIAHDGNALFHNIKTPMEIGRYHSLIVDIDQAPYLRVTASNNQDEIMAIQHIKNPVYGVQFHPESVLTPQGLDIIRNFLNLTRDWHMEQS